MRTTLDLMHPGPQDSALTQRPGDPSPDARSADARPPADEELMPLDPRVRMLWWVAGAGVVAQVGVVVGLVDLLAPLPFPRGLLTGVILTVLGLGAAVLPLVRYRRWRYALRSDALWIRHGVLWVTVSVIPFSRLQFVDTRQGPLDRLFGLSQLVVHTAALGTSGRLPGLDAAEAERLRERLAEVDPSDDASV
jgi:uncharacterized protein